MWYEWRQEVLSGQLIRALSYTRRQGVTKFRNKLDNDKPYLNRLFYIGVGSAKSWSQFLNNISMGHKMLLL